MNEELGKCKIIKEHSIECYYNEALELKKEVNNNNDIDNSEKHLSKIGRYEKAKIEIVKLLDLDLDSLSNELQLWMRKELPIELHLKIDSIEELNIILNKLALIYTKHINI